MGERFVRNEEAAGSNPAVSIALWLSRQDNHIIPVHKTLHHFFATSLFNDRADVKPFTLGFQHHTCVVAQEHRELGV